VVFNESDFSFAQHLPPEDSLVDHNPISSSYENFNDIGPTFGQFGETLQHEVERPLELGLPDSHQLGLSHDKGSEDLSLYAHSPAELSSPQAQTDRGSLENGSPAAACSPTTDPPGRQQAHLAPPISSPAQHSSLAAPQPTDLQPTYATTFVIALDPKCPCRLQLDFKTSP